MFAGFLEYTEEEFKELWEQAIFVVDTNVLINFYKYTNKETTQNLFDILKELKKANRLWIPHQVALEYFFNYENNMYKQNEGYHLLGKKLKNLKEDAKKSLTKFKVNIHILILIIFSFLLKTWNSHVKNYKNNWIKKLRACQMLKQ
nr:PIN-like domain-containing protein [Parageobacillus thermoglucosidasius]